MSFYRPELVFDPYTLLKDLLAVMGDMHDLQQRVVRLENQVIQLQKAALTEEELEEG